MASPRPSSLTPILAWLRRRRLWPWLVGAVLLIVVVRALLPVVAARLLERQLAAQLGRVVAVGNVDFGFLAGTAAIENVSIGGPPGDETSDPHGAPEHRLLGFDRVAVAWRWLPLLAGELHLRALELDAPSLRVLRDEQGRLVPLRLAAAPPPETPEEPEAEDAGGMPIRLDLLRIRGLDALLANLAREDRPPLAFHLDELALSDLSFANGNFELGSVTLSSPRLRVLRDLSLDGLLGPSEAAGEAAPAAAPTPAPPVEAAPGETPEPGAAPSWRIREARIDAADFTLITGDSELEASLHLAAKNVHAASGERFPLEISLGVAGGSVDLTGELGLTPVSFRGSLVWSDLPLERLATAAGDVSPARVAAGTSSGSLEVAFDLAGDGGGLDLGLSGRAGVAGLDLALTEPDLSLAWSELGVGIDSIVLAAGEPPRIALSELRLEDPRVETKRQATSAAASDAAPVEEPAVPVEEPAVPVEEPAAPESPSASPNIAVGVLEIRNGKISFDDPTVSPPLRSRIRALEVHGRDLRWPERRAAELTVRGRGPTGGSFHGDAALGETSGRFDLALQDVGLAPFSAYAADSAGYRLEEGTLTLNAQGKVEGERTELTSDILLKHLDVDEVEAGRFLEQFGVPLDVGLALLRGPGGGIGLPVSLTLDRGETDVGLLEIMAGALRTALIGALATPLKGLGMIATTVRLGGRAGIEPIAFPAGAEEPAGSEQERVVALAEMLEGRPSLGLRLRGRAGPADDPALAEQSLIAAIEADEKLPPVDAGFLQRRRLVGALEARGQGRSGELEGADADALAAWIASVPVDDAQREALARGRAERLRDELVTTNGVDASRLSIGEPLAGEPGVVIELATVGAE